MAEEHPKWSLERLLHNLHQDVENSLRSARESFGHAPTKGDVSEAVWRELLDAYLPKRYWVLSGHVCDSEGNFSQQMDVIVADRQYSPLIFKQKDQFIVPAESVYAVFEAKQALNAKMVSYAQEKAATVRKLHRTSRPIKWLKGSKDKKELMPIWRGYSHSKANGPRPWETRCGQRFDPTILRAGWISVRSRRMGSSSITPAAMSSPRPRKLPRHSCSS